MTHFFLPILIIISVSTSCFGQYTFDFESNTKSILGDVEESFIEQIVNGVTLRISTSNNTGDTKYTQLSDFTGYIRNFSGNGVTTSRNINTFHFTFSEPVYLGTILTGRIGEGYIEQVYSDDNSPANTKTINHVGSSNVSLGWQNVTAFTVTNDAGVAALPAFDDITFIPMSEFSNTLTYIPDDIFEQNLIDIGLDDVLDDSVKTQNILFQNILNLIGAEDLTGIENFWALRYLYCRECSNLSGKIDLNSNSNLELLVLNNSNVTSIDLSSNSALKYLQVTGNPLSSIHLSIDADISRVELNDNKLTTLDLSYFPSLTYVELDNNSLKNLNLANGNNSNISDFSVEGNPNLSCIKVSDESYSNNHFNLIDEGVTFATNCETIVNSNTKGVIHELFISQNSLYIQNDPNSEISFIQIMDLQGKILIKASNFEIKNKRIDLSTLSDGSYFINIKSNHENLGPIKVIKK